MKYKKYLWDYISITISSILIAIAVNMIFKNTGLAPGGITGLSIIFSTITGIPISYMTLTISIPLLVLATFLLGKNFGIKTLYITITTPLCMEIIPSINIFKHLAYLPLFQLSIAALLGGVLVGSAIGIALNHDCATGGTDVIALLIQYFFKNLKLSNILLFLDGFVVITSGVITKNILISLFSLISLFIIIQTIKFITKQKLKIAN